MVVDLAPYSLGIKARELSLCSKGITDHHVGKKVHTYMRTAEQSAYRYRHRPLYIVVCGIGIEAYREAIEAI